MSHYYAAVGLHSNQSVVVVIDENDQPVWKGRLPNDLELVLEALEPYREELVRALAVEMHENWIEAVRYLNMQYLRGQKRKPSERCRRRRGFVQ